jgi:hypothetical protein
MTQNPVAGSLGVMEIGAFLMGARISCEVDL